MIWLKTDLDAYVTEIGSKTHSITGLATNFELTADKNKIPNVSRLVKKTDLNAKVTEIESEICSITGLATNSVLAVVENKITKHDAKKSGIEKKVTDHDHDKYITTSEFNKLTTENFKARLGQENLVTKTDFDEKLKSLCKKVD